ncbi:Fur family transcriptional regulator [Abiotrophia defectiva]|jgi:hypothetical protein|uniref:Fur family transcriptional regulator n=1 Tax=Abiotrophia defectiva TaxID=46125 RepID=UPI0028D04A4E|nr:Fur family transcriptional regulator [Abiotrophia defectiva]
MVDHHHHDCHGHHHCQSHDHQETEDMSVDEIVQRGMAQLKAAGYKMTKKRQEILHLFAENQRYLSAKYIHQQLAKDYPTMSYNTTYRNIYDFVDEGLLEATEYNGEQMFRINCWNCDHGHHHHHFICTVCGRTIPLDACPMDQVKTDLSQVEIEWHRFDVFGKCAQCKGKS